MTTPFHATKQAISLAVFGKHPGWDDHIEDLGIETPRLIAIRQAFYVEGIGGNVESGAWDKLEQEHKRIPLHHAVVWPGPDSLVVGRLWASRDGKGRTKYPMVAFIECAGFPWSWVIQRLFPLLEVFEGRCRAALSAPEIRNIISGVRAELKNLAAAPVTGEDALATWKKPSELPAFLADCAALGPAAAGLHRILYKIYRELPAYAPPGAAAATKEQRRPNHLRVPRCADSLERTAYAWTLFMLNQMDPSTPLLLLLPIDETWMDMLVGTPAVSQLYCLQASSAALPLTSDIPYKWEPSFDSQVEKVLAASRRQDAGGLSIFGPAKAGPGGSGGLRQRINQGWKILTDWKGS
ncbi:MAG: hypothetical protein V2A34_05915 [Lentisphaerota bacterium]